MERVPQCINTYMELKDKLPDKAYKIFVKIFNRLDKYTFVAKNIVDEEGINDGYTLIPTEKRLYENIEKKQKDELKSYYMYLKDQCFKNSGRFEYYNSFLILLDNVNYLDIEEQISLNFLFLQLANYHKELDTVKGEDNKFKLRNNL